jgi:pimeloyl-ACP methyl ester carboxylesterase
MAMTKASFPGARWLEAMTSGNPMEAFAAYQIDSWQRAVLFWDVLRKRGNDYVAHERAGLPPVLTFDHELVVDGATLPRPTNYTLLHVVPPPGCVEDPAKRPFVVIDPRAGHGPGIGGMKQESQVGVALRAGHAVYFVSFRPEPEPGQTLADIAATEAHFLRTVVERHPECETKPAVIGNCQGGWALMLVAAYAPELQSVVSISGAPLSYWAGVRGTNPMRYSGGLLGGSWPATFLGDLGHGRFDGAWLVSNFEQLDPANTLWKKPYNLYRKVDTEEPRFLAFERWWGGHVLLNTEEMRAIVNELFVGNKLSRGRIVAQDGTPIDLRAVRAPIVVICSKGDNITPPQQALNWILDLYDDVDEIRACEQTIIYTVHDSVGHLGIFVSAKVALKEHAEFVSSVDHIEGLPPGLYEMVIEEAHEEDSGTEREHEAYVVRFEARTLDDIRAFDDGRADEEPFEAVARFAEIGEGVYETMVRPWVRAMATPASAAFMREMHPDRLQRRLLSDQNPWMHSVAATAAWVRANRTAVGDENVFVQAEKQMGAAVEQALDGWRDARDQAQERTFEAIWTNPAVRALVGAEAPFADFKKPRASHRRLLRRWVELKLELLRQRCRQGGFPEAVLRIILAGVAAAEGVDARGVRAARRVWRSEGLFEGMSRAELLRIFKEEAFLLQFDRAYAMATLPDLLPTRAERERAMRIIDEMQSWRPEMLPELAAVRREVAEILGLEGGKTTAVDEAADPAAQ